MMVVAVLMLYLKDRERAKAKAMALAGTVVSGAILAANVQNWLGNKRVM